MSGGRTLVSIVMPTYERRPLIGDAIDSVRAQTLEEFELIVVDDGSTDGTAEMLAERYGDDPRIVVVRIEHAGVAAARNIGLERARGLFVTFLDSDDLMLPECLVSQVAHLQLDPDAAMVVCDAFSEDVDRTRTLLSESEAFRAPSSLAAMFAGGWSYIHTMLVKTSVAQELGFRTEYAVAEDTDFQFRYFIEGHHAFQNPEPLVVRRAHDGSSGADHLSRDDVARARARLRMMREHQAHAPDPQTYARVERYLCRRIAKGLAARGQYREARPFVRSCLQKHPFRPRLLAWYVAGWFQREEVSA